MYLFLQESLIHPYILHSNLFCNNTLLFYTKQKVAKKLLTFVFCLSPAYDLLPSNGMNGFHTTSVNDNITPTTDDLIAVAVKAGLNKKEALTIFEEMRNKVDFIL